jgi:hypothetical protein
VDAGFQTVAMVCSCCSTADQAAPLTQAQAEPLRAKIREAR